MRYRASFDHTAGWCFSVGDSLIITHDWSEELVANCQYSQFARAEAQRCPFHLAPATLRSVEPTSRKQLVRLFGPNGTERHSIRWGKWLRDNGGPLAINGLTLLEAEGCSRTFIIRMLMEVHATFFWPGVTRREAASDLKVITQAERAIRRLAQSNLREILGLDPGDDETWGVPALADHLALVQDNLENCRGRIGAHQGADFDRNNALSQLITYVVETTHKQHDEAFDQLLRPVLGRTFSTHGWRGRHLKALKASGTRKRRVVHRGYRVGRKRRGNRP